MVKGARGVLQFSKLYTTFSAVKKIFSALSSSRSVIFWHKLATFVEAEIERETERREFPIFE